MPMTLRARKLPAGFWKGTTGRKTTSRSKTTRAVKSLAPRARKAVATIATRVMNRKTETKYVAQLLATEPTDIYGHTMPANGLPQLFDCLPALSTGDEEFHRTGVRVNPTKHTVDIDLRFNESKLSSLPAIKMAAAAWDIQVHVWYGYARRFKNSAEVLNAAPTLLSQLLEDGQGNNVYWDGTSLADFNRLNKEVMVLKHKKFRMFRPSGSQNTADSTQQTYFPQVIRKRVSLSFKPPKTLMYNDNVDLPDNYAPFVIIGYQHTDGTNASSIQYIPQAPTVANCPALQLSMKSHLWFKDP